MNFLVENWYLFATALVSGGLLIWPGKSFIVIGFALLFIQGISELMKSLWAARTGQFLVHQEKLEL